MHPGECPSAARACDEILSLPLHPRPDATAERRRGIATSFRKDTTRASADNRRRRLHRIPSRRSAARARRQGHRPRQPVDRIDRQHRAPQGARRVRVLHRLGRQRAASWPSSIDRSDVVFHLAAAVGVKLIVEQPVLHHRDQRPRHRGRAEAREQEEEARRHRVDVGGLRQERGRAVPRGRRPRDWGRRPSTAGRTPAARRSTSSSRWRTGKSASCP